MAVVGLRAVVALLGRFPALAGINLVVERGEVVLVQGPNGAGKSTLLRLCSGLLRLESGRAEVLGYDLKVDRAALRREVGLLGHDTALYDDLSVNENMAFWARAARVPVADISGALDRLEVADRLRDLGVAQLSAGQRRRVGIAAVVLRRPSLWLLDEPHAGLDRSARDLVDSLVVEAAAAGATVMVASHELERTLGLATRRITVAGGTIVDDTSSSADTEDKTEGGAG